MKRTARCDPAAATPVARRVQRGFTLIELLVAMAILAVIAALSWRGFSQIIRGREAITRSMANERVFAQLFDQIRIDARLAVPDDEAGEAAVSLSGNTLQIVRPFAAAPDTAPRLQVVRYRIADGRLVRYASPPLGSLGALQRTLHDGADASWSAVPLMSGIGAINVRFYVPKTGWTLSMKDVYAAITANDNDLKMPLTGSAPLPRAVTGLEVSIGSTSLQQPVVRVFLVGE